MKLEKWTRIKYLVIFTLSIFILQPDISHSKGIDILLDVSTYKGADKLDIIAEGLTGFIKENPKLSIKIKLYGFPFSGRNEKRLTKALSNLKWVKISKTDSLQKALSNLEPEKSIYIVISGGKGNWDVIKELLREKEAIRPFIIGVSLPHPDIMRRLLGVASAGGGKYFNAANAAKLKKALLGIEKRANYDLEIRAYRSGIEELTGYLMARYKYLWGTEVYKAGDREKPIDDSFVFPARFNLPTGTYDIKVRYTVNVMWLKGVKVEKWSLTEKEVNFATDFVK